MAWTFAGQSPRTPRQRRDRKFQPNLQSFEPRVLLSASAADVLTYHNDNGRTGQDLDETILTPQNVNAFQFGKRFTLPVDGQVYAQPLYVANVAIPGKGVHNVVYVATEHDSVYAFDADSGSPVPLWHDSFINPAFGITTIPAAEIPGTNIAPEVGITSTPVIDPASGTLYAVTQVKVAGLGDLEFLHALDITTGAERPGGPALIQGAVRGRGTGRDRRGVIAFQPNIQLQRPGLLLENGVVYAAFGSFGDIGPYHGWILGYNALTLQQVSVFNVTPNSAEGSIWMSGGGLAADALGNIYAATANGGFSAGSGRGLDFSNSLLKLAPAPAGLRVADFFTPKNQAFLSKKDLDFGSGGVLVLPDQAGPVPHQAVAVDKNGTLYLVNRDAMGRFRAKRNNLLGSFTNFDQAFFSMPAYYNGKIYVNPNGGTLSAYQLAGGTLQTTPISRSPFSLDFPGATPSISANGNANGIVWEIQSDSWADPAGQAVLRAFDANDLSHELYDSTQAGTRDKALGAVKFTVPTIANGKVYVGTQYAVTVYGLLGG